MLSDAFDLAEYSIDLLADLSVKLSKVAYKLQKLRTVHRKNLGYHIKSDHFMEISMHTRQIH